MSSPDTACVEISGCSGGKSYTGPRAAALAMGRSETAHLIRLTGDGGQLKASRTLRRGASRPTAVERYFGG